MKPEPAAVVQIHSQSRLCGARDGGTSWRWSAVTCPKCLEALLDADRQQDEVDARATENQDRLFRDGGRE